MLCYKDLFYSKKKYMINKTILKFRESDRNQLRMVRVAVSIDCSGVPDSVGNHVGLSHHKQGRLLQ